MNNMKVYKKQVDNNSFVPIGEAISNSCNSEKESHKTN